MRILCRLACLVVVVLLAFDRSVAYGGTVVDEPSRGYTVTLPEGWGRIPVKAIDEMTANVVAASGGKMSQHYDDGFQQSASGQWFKYPYVLVQVNEKGRISEEKLSQLKTFRQGLQKGMDDIGGKLPALVSDLSLGDTYYDASNKCILIRFSMNATGVGEVKALTCGFLTQKGMVVFHCYALAADFDHQLPVFQAILAKVQIPEQLRYQPGSGGSVGLDFNRILRSGLIGGMVGGVVGLIGWLTRRKKTRGRRHCHEC